MTWNIRSFSVNRSIEFETLHGSLVVYCCDFQRARSNLDVFDNLWCARSVQQEFSHAWTVPCISAPCSCCTESQCLLSGHFCCCMHFVWYYSVLGKFMMSKLWILNWDLILNFLLAFCMVLVPRPILILSGSALSFWDMGAIKRNDRCDSRINCIHKMSGQQI